MAPHTYTPEEKANALIHLYMNGGDVTHTSNQLGIPVRTLRDWRGKWYAENPPPPPSQRQIQRPEFEDDLDALDYVRNQIIAELLTVADSLREGTLFTTPSQRIQLLSQLLDRLIKLDQHLKPYRPPVVEMMRLRWDTGLYLRTEAGYRGPYAPNDLPKRWKEKFGPSTRLEIFWDDHTFTVLPDEGPLLEHILNVKDFDDEPCDYDPDMGDDEPYDYDYGWNHKGG